MNQRFGNMPSHYDPESDPNQDPFVVPIEDVLDLHSVSAKDVEAVVLEYLSEVRRLGFKAIRIIHGRGIGVQREIVRKALSRTSFVTSYGDAPAEAGGWGATVVNLE
jgi:dsDNA-specific endonuclease/ATPase MutS2